MIRQNALVQLKQSYCDWVETVPEMENITERRFFYLGNVPNVPDMCLLATFGGLIINSYSIDVIEELDLNFVN